MPNCSTNQIPKQPDADISNYVNTYMYMAVSRNRLIDHQAMGAKVGDLVGDGFQRSEVYLIIKIRRLDS